MLSCCIWFSAPSFWMGGGLDSRCVVRVYGADGAVRVCRRFPISTKTEVGQLKWIDKFRFPIIKFNVNQFSRSRGGTCVHTDIRKTIDWGLHNLNVSKAHVSSDTSRSASGIFCIPEQLRQ